MKQLNIDSLSCSLGDARSKHGVLQLGVQTLEQQVQQQAAAAQQTASAEREQKVAVQLEGKSVREELSNMSRSLGYAQIERDTPQQQQQTVQQQLASAQQQQQDLQQQLRQSPL